jgi:hypothetical protein
MLADRLKGLFWAGNEVVCSFFHGLSAWPLEASHYDLPSREAMEFIAKGLNFGLSLLRLHTLPSRRFQFLTSYWLFSAIPLVSPQSLAIQSHNISTWTAIL